MTPSSDAACCQGAGLAPAHSLPPAPRQPPAYVTARGSSFPGTGRAWVPRAFHTAPGGLFQKCCTENTATVKTDDSGDFSSQHTARQPPGGATTKRQRQASEHPANARTPLLASSLAPTKQEKLFCAATRMHVATNLEN